MKISACLIVRNESDNLYNCLSSIKDHVDQIVVVDTGSTDDTISIAKQFNAKIDTFLAASDEEGLFDFSQARNRSFELADHNCVIWLDADDIVKNPENIRKLLQSNTRIFLPYEYSHDVYGNVSLLHYRDRIITDKSKVRWTFPIHESIETVGPINDITSNEVTIVHTRKQGSTHRNLRLLKKWLLNHPNPDQDPRLLFYLAQEYYAFGDNATAITYLNKYIKISTFQDEKIVALLRLADCYHRLGNLQDAIHAATSAISIRHDWTECYFALSRYYYFQAWQTKEKQLWEKCVHFALAGLSMPNPSTNMFLDPSSKFNIYKYLNYAYNELGYAQQALESVNIGLTYLPHDIELLANKKFYEVQIAKSNNVEICTLKHTRKTKSKSITFYAGNAYEQWSPDSINTTGLGGSETALVKVAKMLSDKGHKVKVYAMCQGNYDGVEYIPYDQIDQAEYCDVFITSRRPDIVSNVKAGKIYCWLHDAINQPMTYDQCNKIDKFITVSNWHAKHVLSSTIYVHPQQMVVINNGINTEYFEQLERRNPYRVIYSSSPDRGLDTLLKLWSKIYQQVPKAELHVYYGFNGMNLRGQYDTSLDSYSKYIQGLLADMKGMNVIQHDRIPQQALAKEMLLSGIWAYPSAFPETSCISAMEAQAAGLHIISTELAALPETVGDRGILIDDDARTESYQQMFVEHVVKYLKTPDIKFRAKVRSYAMDNFDWSDQLQSWLNLIHS